MKAIRVLSGVVPGPSLPSGGSDPVGNWRNWCAVERCNPSEPMIASDTLLRPLQKVGMDMFVYKKATYLLVVDYASSYVAKLAATPSPDVIMHLRSIFTRHGIPETVVSDIGPQYASYEFAQFSSEEGLIHVTSSPRYPQSNDKAERILQTVTAMLKKSVDPYGALLTYRTISLECGYSPAQLLMGRQVRTSILVMASTLQPRWIESKQLRDRQENIKTRQTVDFCKLNKTILESKTGILTNKLSDHQPYFMSLQITQKKELLPKYVKIHIVSIEAMHNVRHEIKSEEIYNKFNKKTNRRS